MRARREIIGSLYAMFPVGGSDKQIQIFDAHNCDDTMIATLVRKELTVEDKAVRQP